MRRYSLWLSATLVGICSAIVVGALFIHFSPPIYLASAWIGRRPQPSFMSPDAVDLPIELIRSPQVLESVVREMPELWQQPDPIDWLAGQIQIDSTTPAGSRVSFTGPTLQQANTIRDEVVSSYLRWNEEVRADRKSDYLDTLRFAERSLREDLLRTSKQLAQQSERRGPQYLAELEGRLASNEIDRLTLEAKIEALQERGPTEDGLANELREDPTIRRLRARMRSIRDSYPSLKETEERRRAKTEYDALRTELNRWTKALWGQHAARTLNHKNELRDLRTELAKLYASADVLAEERRTYHRAGQLELRRSLDREQSLHNEIASEILRIRSLRSAESGNPLFVTARPTETIHRSLVPAIASVTAFAAAFSATVIVGKRTRFAKSFKVLFTTYCPRTVEVNSRYSLLVYGHEARFSQAVAKDANKFSEDLGGELPEQRRAVRSSQLRIGALITVVPECDAIQFEPPTLTKTWRGKWTRFVFDFTPQEQLKGDALLIRVSVQVAGFEIAHIMSAVDVEAAPTAESDAVEETNTLAASKTVENSSYMYERIFVSYSDDDALVVRRYRLAQDAAGNDVFVDTYSIRSGENWRRSLAEAIDSANFMQLFWSSNSANSRNVKEEWKYALWSRGNEDGCVGFIRPVYWKRPMPDPPEPISHLNFRFVAFE